MFMHLNTHIHYVYMHLYAGLIEIMYYSTCTETQRDWLEKLFVEFSPESLLCTIVWLL